MQLVVYLAVEDSTVDMDAKNHQHNLHEKTHQSILEVNRGGKMLFPLSHFTYSSSHFTTQYIFLLTWESFQGRYAGIQFCPKGGRDLKSWTQAHKYVQ